MSIFPLPIDIYRNIRDFFQKAREDVIVRVSTARRVVMLQMENHRSNRRDHSGKPDRKAGVKKLNAVLFFRAPSAQLAVAQETQISTLLSAHAAQNG